MLKDMLIRLGNEISWTTAILQKLKTIGFIHGGLNQMLMELDCPEGYVCRVHKGDVYKIADC
ncbi:9292_t:CDS:2, partial [Paraglomus brasilianum]